MDSPVISVHQLSRRFGKRVAVSRLSFDVARGEIVGLLGANGAGKTTTLQMLAGASAPDSGSITICGHSLSTEPLAAKRCLGFLPEHPPLYRDLTVDAFLKFAARLRGVPATQAAAAVERAKRRCNLMEVGPRRIGKLSKGFQQRVGLAQATLHEPSVVILDEPTVALDPMQIKETRQLISSLKQSAGVILSTHLLNEAEQLCDRVVILRDGNAVFHGQVDEIRARSKSRVVMLALRQPPEAAELAAIGGVRSVEAVDATHFRLHTEDDDAVSERIGERAAQSGWGLYQLNIEQQNLEDLFVELSSQTGMPGVP